MAKTPDYYVTIKNGTCFLNTSNTNRNNGGGVIGSTSGSVLQSLLAATSTEEIIVNRVYIRAAGTVATTSAGTIRLWYYDGTNFCLVQEIAVTAVAPAAGTPGFNSIYEFPGGFPLSPNTQLLASTEIGDSGGNQFRLTAVGYKK